MYALFTSLSSRQLVLEQLPSLAVSMIIAEMFYRFHSFTLETLAFLATWFAVDGLGRMLRKHWA